MPTVYGPHIPYKEWAFDENPDPVKNRQNWLEVERWAARINEQLPSGGLPPTASLAGSTVLATGAYPQPPVAGRWWQSAGIDSYVNVIEYNSGHTFVTLKPCTLLVTTSATIGLQVHTNGAGDAGEWAVNTDIFYDGGASGYIDDLWTDVSAISGSWKRSAHPDATQSIAGITATRIVHLDAADFKILPGIYQAMGYTATVNWTCSVVLLEDCTIRTLPDIPSPL